MDQTKIKNKLHELTEDPLCHCEMAYVFSNGGSSSLSVSLDKSKKIYRVYLIDGDEKRLSFKGELEDSAQYIIEFLKV